jgi:hypothetical protein
VLEPIHTTISLGHSLMIKYRFSLLALPATFATSGLLKVANKQRCAPMARSLRSHTYSLSGHNFVKEHTH